MPLSYKKSPLPRLDGMYWIGMLTSDCYLYEPRQVWNNRVIQHTLLYPDVVPTHKAYYSHNAGSLVLISDMLPLRLYVVDSRVEHGL
jgi:hypothetical protein